MQTGMESTSLWNWTGGVSIFLLKRVLCNRPVGDQLYVLDWFEICDCEVISMLVSDPHVLHGSILYVFTCSRSVLSSNLSPLNRLWSCVAAVC